MVFPRHRLYVKCPSCIINKTYYVHVQGANKMGYHGDFPLDSMPLNLYSVTLTLVVIFRLPSSALFIEKRVTRCETTIIFQHWLNLNVLLVKQRRCWRGPLSGCVSGIICLVNVSRILEYVTFDMQVLINNTSLLCGFYLAALRCNTSDHGMTFDTAPIQQ